MIAIGLIGVLLRWRGSLTASRWYLGAVQHAWPLGFIAILAGWWVTETGRQPWVAQGILRTVDAVSPVAAGAVAISLALFVLVYGVVFSMGILYINRLIDRGPASGAEPHDTTASRPLGAAADAARAALGRKPEAHGR